MEKTIIIKPHVLKAISLAAGKEGVRLYLQGVYIEIFENGAYSLVATDGNRLYGWNLAKDILPSNNYIFASGDIDILLRMAESIKETHKKQADSINIQLTLVEGAIKASITMDELALWEVTCYPMIGNFPQWRRFVFVENALVESSPQEPFALNSAYLAAFDKLAKCFGESCAVKFDAKGGANTPIEIALAKQPLFRGVIMPMRWNACN